jgi:hypothetical protein
MRHDQQWSYAAQSNSTSNHPLFPQLKIATNWQQIKKKKATTTTAATKQAERNAHAS